MRRKWRLAVSAQFRVQRFGNRWKQTNLVLLGRGGEEEEARYFSCEARTRGRAAGTGSRDQNDQDRERGAALQPMYTISLAGGLQPPRGQESWGSAEDKAFAAPMRYRSDLTPKLSSLNWRVMVVNKHDAPTSGTHRWRLGLAWAFATAAAAPCPTLTRPRPPSLYLLDMGSDTMDQCKVKLLLVHDNTKGRRLSRRHRDHRRPPPVGRPPFLCRNEVPDHWTGDPIPPAVAQAVCGASAACGRRRQGRAAGPNCRSPFTMHLRPQYSK